MTTLGLVMIVRDEAHGIRATIESIRPVLDGWTIYDTGSTDGTQQIVRELLADIPGELHEGAFVDFAHARNRALDLHGERTTWSLMLDADDIVTGCGSLRVAIADARAEDQAMHVRRKISTSWWVPTLMRCSSRWRYRGRVHEYACGPVGELTARKVEGCTVIHVRPQQSQQSVRARWQRDLGLLEQDLAAGTEVPRSLFYLAQTCECLGDLERAQSLYAKRIMTPGWHHETYEARLRRARCLLGLQRPQEAVVALLEAYASDPTRCEPLVELAAHYRKAGQFAPALLFARQAAALPVATDGLFIDDDAYACRRWDELAVAAYYEGRRIGDRGLVREGAAAADRALAAHPDDERLLRNRAFFD